MNGESYIVAVDGAQRCAGAGRRKALAEVCAVLDAEPASRLIVVADERTLEVRALWFRCGPSWSTRDSGWLH